MTAAREEILARIGAALAPVRSPAAEIPRSYRRAAADSGGPAVDPVHRTELVELLIDRLGDYRATVSRCEPDGVPDLLAQRLSEHAIESVLVPGGFPEQWLSATSALRRTDQALTAAELDGIDGVLCTCALAIAETGTIVLDGGPGQGRRALSLVPDYLLIVLETGQVVAGVPEAVARLDPRRPLTWISGPSATSDIELQRVEGVHGPRTLDVILLDSRGPLA
jgi:L-lactate dehydrogenase complex protein LldG